MQDETHQGQEPGKNTGAETGADRDETAVREARWTAVAETDADGVSIHPQAVLSRREHVALERQTYAGASDQQRNERAWRLDNLVDHARNLRAVRELLQTLDAGSFSEEDRRLGVPEADRDRVLQAYDAHLASLFEEVARLDQIDRALELQEMVMCWPHDRTVFYLPRREAEALVEEARARDVPLETVLKETVEQGMKLMTLNRQAELAALGRDSLRMAEAAAQEVDAMAEDVAAARQALDARRTAQAPASAAPSANPPAPGDAAPEPNLPE